MYCTYSHVLYIIYLVFTVPIVTHCKRIVALLRQCFSAGHHRGDGSDLPLAHPDTNTRVGVAGGLADIDTQLVCSCSCYQLPYTETLVATSTDASTGVNRWQSGSTVPRLHSSTGTGAGSNVPLGTTERSSLQHHHQYHQQHVASVSGQRRPGRGSTIVAHVHRPEPATYATSRL